MAPLRWILLLGGLVFLVALAAWEMRRSRQVRRDEQAHRDVRVGAGHGEPELGRLPEEFSSGPRPIGGAAGADRVRTVAPPLVELPALQDAPSPALAQRSDPPTSPDLGELTGTADSDVPAAAPNEPNAMLAETPVTPPGLASDGNEFTVGQRGPEPLVAEAAEPAEAGASEAALVVDWPPDGERHIIALRIMAMSEQRLSGRVTRQALAACGFVHGRYGIFHQPSTDGRALLSCASLSKPGIFDPTSMDFQRFAGLSLFTVLPGPLPPSAALERLLETARDLTQRLQARLQDEQGQTLDAARVAALRDSVHGLPAGARGGAQPAEPAEPAA